MIHLTGNHDDVSSSDVAKIYKKSKKAEKNVIHYKQIFWLYLSKIVMCDQIHDAEFIHCGDYLTAKIISRIFAEI